MPKKKLASDPQASRPHMPGYGMMFQGRGKALPWTWVVRRLTTAHNYWVATTRKDFRPHVMPVWGIWLDGIFYFSTGRRSRKSRNLSMNPNCVICPEGAREAVIMEGLAEELRDSDLRRRVRDVYKKKYESDLNSHSADPIYAVRPRVLFGLVENSNKVRGNPTRWRFEPVLLRREGKEQDERARSG